MDQNKTCKYIISLIKALLENIQPPEKPVDISFEDIYWMAKKHHVQNMCFYALEKLEEKPVQELYEQWKNHTSISEAQSAVQLAEKNVIISAFQNTGINTLPLKGCFLKEMYPKPAYREMADLDILVRPDSQYLVKEVMESLGYQLTAHEEFSIHDVYSKPPFMNVEIHRQLLTDEFAEQNHLDISRLPIMNDPWEYVLETARPHIYVLSPEDTYIFLILHLAKHYYRAGTGIRQFTDIWMYNQKYTLDKTYIYNMLSKLGMDFFCINVEKLVHVWYEQGEMTLEIEEMQDYVFSSGVYGNLTNRVINRMNAFQIENDNRSNSVDYVWYRLFPPFSFMKSHYIYVKKYPFLLPVGWIHRLLWKTFGDGSPAIREFRAFMKVINKRNK